MNWMLVNPLRTLSPLGLLAVGAVVGVLGVPVVKKTARQLAVLGVRGALTVSDVVKGAGESLSDTWQQRTDIACSRKANRNSSTSDETAMEFVASLPEHSR